MDYKPRVPEDFRAHTSCVVVGLLKVQPELKAVRTGDYCRAIVEVDKHEHTVVCRGKEAKFISGQRGGTPLEITGQLGEEGWKTEGDRKDHHRTIIGVDNVVSLEEPRVTEDVG